VIDLRYVKYLAYAAIACTLAAAYFWLLQGRLDVGFATLAYLIGAALTSLVTVRLPVFRQYYNARSEADLRKYRRFPNERAAMLLTGLVAGVTVALGLYLAGIAAPVEPAFIGAIAAMVVSQYHESGPTPWL
jgi:putative flippase GtrA